MRFNTRINITKGVNLNVSKSGVSVNFGIPGMNVTVGKHGVTVNRGIPGTYIRQRQKVVNADGTPVKRKKGEGSGLNVPLPAIIGQPKVDPIDYSAQKKSKNLQTKSHIHDADAPFEPYDIDDTNDFDAAMNHLEATAQGSEPSVGVYEHVEDAEFEEISPAREDVIRFNSQREAVINIARLAVPVDTEGTGDVDDLPSTIAGWLSGITLPLEFAVDIGNYNADSGVLFVDVDLPEIEDLPDEIASVAKDGSMKVSEISDAQLREDYVQCVFGLGVFFSSHFFSLTAQLSKVVISAFTQRRNKAGDVVDDYIYSVKFTREGLAQCAPLSEADPFTVAMSMENRCKLSRSNKFGVIEPYTP